MILEIILVLMVLLFVTSCYVIWNLMTKQEMLEDWITNFIETIEKIDFDLKPTSTPVQQKLSIRTIRSVAAWT